MREFIVGFLAGIGIVALACCAVAPLWKRHPACRAPRPEDAFGEDADLLGGGAR
jgi:hypothetical protein